MPDIAIADARNSELSPCPHCAAQARIVADERFRWVCGTCGGPRIPVADPGLHSDLEARHLKQAVVYMSQARLTRVGASITGIGAAVLGVLAILTGFLPITHVVPLLLLVLSLVASAFTIVMGSSAQKKVVLAKENVTSAWEAVAEAVMHAQRAPMTALDLAQSMKTDEADAERLLTLLSVDDRVRAEVTNDAQLRYAPTFSGREAGLLANSGREAGLLATGAVLRVEVDKALPESAELAHAQSEEERATAQTVMAPVPSELVKK